MKETHKDSISGTCAVLWEAHRFLVDQDIFMTLGEELQPWALGLFSCNERTVALAIPHELGLVLEVALCLQN